MKLKPFLLMILDGYGISGRSYGNAVHDAKTPNLDKLYSEYPHTLLSCSGEAVGLPAGQMGNSEVGHLNIGAGRVIYQELSRINNAISDGSFFENSVLIHAIEHVKKNKSTLNLLGLLSDGGVHSHREHLIALVKMAEGMGVEKIAVHAFTDGRDVPPRSALKYVDGLEDKIATVSGRYYAMDRDNRWDRVEKAYEAMTSGLGLRASSASDAIERAYERNENDEFIQPTNIGDVTIRDDDAIVFFNFRPDRARELTRAFTDPEFDGFARKKVINNLAFTTMTQYDVTMPGVTVAYPPEFYKNTLGEYISSLGMKQLRIAETEKYAHVTFFLNGGIEKESPGEDRVLVPSPQVATYDLQPEMSAYSVTDEVIHSIDSKKYDLIILNFANLDMVGHSGIFDAVVKAAEAVDTCVGSIVKKILEKGGQILLTADHGNSEAMLDNEGNVITAHSTNPVPLICIRENAPQLEDGGSLCDIAPTILRLMGLNKPPEMTGRSLVD